MPLEVHPYYVIPLLFGYRHEHPVTDETGVVHQGVKPSPLLGSRRHELGPIRPVGDVAAGGDRRPALGGDLADYLFCCCRVEVVGHDVRTRGREGQRVFPSDAPSGTGNDDNPVLTDHADSTAFRKAGRSPPPCTSRALPVT